MKFLRIESTKFTPGIVLDPSHNVLEFYGFSLPENAIDFYQPILNWLTDFKKELENSEKNKSSEINVIFKLVYFNSSSLRQLVEVFHILSEINNLGVPIHISWQYDSEDPQMADSGKELGDITHVPVSVVAYN
jgi:hypothetical protein